MSTIPVSLTEEQFNEHIRPHLNTARRGYECKIPLYKVFNYILYRLHTGCQWHHRHDHVACQLTAMETSQKKRNQLPRCLLPFLQVEPRW